MSLDMERVLIKYFKKQKHSLREKQEKDIIYLFQKDFFLRPWIPMRTLMRYDIVNSNECILQQKNSVSKKNFLS